MKKTALFFSIIFYIPHIGAMKRPRTYTESKVDHRKRLCTSQAKMIAKTPRQSPIVFDLSRLPQEIEDMILIFASSNPNADKPRTAANLVNSLAMTNHYLNQQINKQSFSDDIIDNIASKFFCSHATIARFLNTPASRKRLHLQYQLKQLCCHPYNLTTSNQLDTLIRRGANLEFTYSHSNIQKTALMICTFNKNDVCPLLLEKGADINGCNAHGWSALTLAATFPISIGILRKLINHPDININKQNNRGETALLKTIIDRKNRHVGPAFHIGPAFMDTIRLLLGAKADPELADRNGLTPLIAAKKLGNQEVIELIDNAITQKHAQSQQIIAQ